MQSVMSDAATPTAFDLCAATLEDKPRKRQSQQERLSVDEDERPAGLVLLDAEGAPVTAAIIHEPHYLVYAEL